MENVVVIPELVRPTPIKHVTAVIVNIEIIVPGAIDREAPRRVAQQVPADILQHVEGLSAFRWYQRTAAGQPPNAQVRPNVPVLQEAVGVVNQGHVVPVDYLQHVEGVSAFGAYAPRQAQYDQADVGAGAQNAGAEQWGRQELAAQASDESFEMPRLHPENAVKDEDITDHEDNEMGNCEVPDLGAPMVSSTSDV